MESSWEKGKIVLKLKYKDIQCHYAQKYQKNEQEKANTRSFALTNTHPATHKQIAAIKILKNNRKCTKEKCPNNDNTFFRSLSIQTC